MRVVQRGFILRLRRHGAVAHLLLPSHHLVCGSQHRRLGRGTDAKGTEGGPNLQVVHRPSATIDQLGDQEASLLLNRHRFLLNRTAQLAFLVFPLRHLGFFTLPREDSQRMLIPNGETQSP